MLPRTCRRTFLYGSPVVRRPYQIRSRPTAAKSHEGHLLSCRASFGTLVPPTHSPSNRIHYHPSLLFRKNTTFRGTTHHFASSASLADDDSAPEPDTSAPSSSSKSVEEQYSRKTPLEHVLLRPGMYIGPVERLPPNQCWVLDPIPSVQQSANQDASLGDSAVGSTMRMVRREYGLIPALIKIFDEILVNASDNRLRHPKTCTKIEVTIDPGSKDGGEPFISVLNDGTGIPVQMHRKEGLYVPEMLFGHLLTGSNFDDSEKRVTGGRHGYGAKLSNIFSKSFTVETLDSKNGKRYRQTWRNNMTEASEPEINSVETDSTDYTRISFVPDMARLSGDPTAMAIQEEDYAVMCRRVVDVAGCAAGYIQVFLNGVDVSMDSFGDYSKLYRMPESPPMVFHRINSRWEVGVGLSDGGSFDSVSFVNGMATSRGGTHVNAIVQQITKTIADRVAKIHTDLEETVTQGLIRRHLFVSCNCLIVNPTFDSQMKESLTSNPTSFGSKCTLSKRFLAEIVVHEEEGGPGIVEEVIRIARGRQQASLLKEVGGGKKSRRQLLSIPKLEDAHHAGGSDSSDCTLILTEGDSAKALAVAGLEVIGREKYGVFPLRGKFLNVRHATVLQLTDNAEVKALCSILGLDFDNEYDTQAERAGLRYGHVMLMTDQDTDGSHIKGLVMNFFRHFWPKLLKPAVDQPLQKPFLSSFITPLLKVTRKSKKDTLSFYSMAEYLDWRNSLSHPDDVKKWTVKYYKGLGTSTPAEAKQYFSAFSAHHRPFHWNSDMDGELLDMVFDKQRAADRRHWILEEYDERDSLVPNEDNSVSYEEFVNKEMVHFSNADNVRSLPSAIDGLKPSQRKVLYACFKRKLRSEIKVAQLTGYCAEHTAYHHGEASLHSTIIGMAQDFVGSNNVNMLVPSGQFGTRLTGGKDAASPRYIFTHLSPIARLLFPEADDVLLRYREDDGQVIEPEFFCPILPLLLINGAQGIGTGWSTFIPPHNPRDVLSCVRDKLANHVNTSEISPWVRDFKGTISKKIDGTGFVTTGKATKKSKNTVLVSELPIGRWTNNYKQHLLKMRDKGVIQSFIENHTTTEVSFTVTLKVAQLSRMEKTGLEKAFALESSFLTTNMHAFDEDHAIRKYDNAESVMESYFPVRLSLYHDRKSVLESEMNHTSELLRNKARFISAVTNGDVDLVRGKKTKDETVDYLRDAGFTSATELQSIRDRNALLKRREELDQGQKEVEGNPDGRNLGSDYDYLLGMPLSSLAIDKIEDLQRQATATEEQLAEVKKKSPEELWRQDLEKIESHL